MPFQFVDNNSVIGPRARRQIRSHAATGKNVGKTIKRRSRKGDLSSNETSYFQRPDAIRRGDAPPGAQGAQELIPKVNHQIVDSLSTIFLPVHVSPEKRPVIKRGIEFFRGVRYVPEMRSAFDRSKKTPSMWIQLMFIDVAYFHIAMAISMATINGVTPTTEDADKEMCHLSHSLYHVNQRLSSTEATCDATLAVVAMMSQYERHRGRHPNGLLHLKGLYRMVDMRGGISELLREHTVLGQKIIRLDLEYAIEVGSVPLFSMAEVVHARSSTLRLRRCLDTEYSHQVPRFIRHGKLSAALLDIAVEMTTLSWVYNDAISGHRPKISMLDGNIALWELGYRLFHFNPLSEPRLENHLEGAVHLGLIMFMLPFLHKLDGRIPDCPLLYRLVWSAAEDFREVADEAADREALLWMLLIGASSAFPSPHRKPLLSIVRGLAHSLHIETWEDATSMLAGFPWVDVLFHKAGQSLFRAAMSVPVTTWELE